MTDDKCERIRELEREVSHLTDKNSESLGRIGRVMSDAAAQYTSEYEYQCVIKNLEAERDELKGRLFDIDVCKSAIALYSDENDELKKDLAEHRRVMRDLNRIVGRISCSHCMDNPAHCDMRDGCQCLPFIEALALLADEPKGEPDHPSDGPSSLTVSLTNIPMLDYEREIWESDERVYEVTESHHSREYARTYDVKFRVTKPECIDDSEEKTSVKDVPPADDPYEWVRTSETMHTGLRDPILDLDARVKKLEPEVTK
ncbi:MAG: hypothetical protein GY847_14345 [Proteobacteria bacterium]|nr:hypothetical protein [Pseudomonadota bacterium]